MDSFSFAQKRSLIIGGTSSIGLELCKLLQEQGSFVCVTGRKQNKTSNAKFIQCDFENDFFSSINNPLLQQELCTCDILAVCYGPFVQKPLHQTTQKDWLYMAQCNYALPGILVSKALPFMQERKFGSIVLFGGTRTDSIRPYKTNAAYAGAKTGLAVLVKSVATEYSMQSITCNAVLPGFTRNAPDGYLIEESLVAQKALYLLSQRELNGVLLNVDKGW